jgi:hypothetical protein
VLESDQKLQSWFSLVLWEMSKTSPIESASQHNEEFKGHSPLPIFCSFSTWNILFRIWLEFGEASVQKL